MTKIIAIVAYDDNRVIGLDGDMPWYLPEDLKIFKATTTGFPIIMGRNTWFSLPKRPLPGRKNIVISRNIRVKETDCEWCLVQSPENAIEEVKEYEKAFVIGGAQIYNYMLEHDLIDEMQITHVFGNHEGDTFFPEINKKWSTEVISQHDGFEVLKATKRVEAV